MVRHGFQIPIPRQHFLPHKIHIGLMSLHGIPGHLLRLTLLEPESLKMEAQELYISIGFQSKLHIQPLLQVIHFLHLISPLAVIRFQKLKSE